jgi:acetoin utilization protein AcuB
MMAVESENDMPDVAVKEIMATRVKTLGRNDTLDLAKDLMSAGPAWHLPVLDEGRVLGVVSQRDLFRSALMAAVLGFTQGAQRALLHTLRAKDVMSEPAITVSPDTTVVDAARLMLETRIGCLPVLDGGALVGLVTEADALRHFLGASRGEPADSQHSCGAGLARTA